MNKRWPKLTELQLAVLACVRDDDVEPYIDYKRAKFIPRTYGTPVSFRAHGFDVTSQLRSLRSRKLIAFNGYYKNRRRTAHYALSVQGQIELECHPEF